MAQLHDLSALEQAAAVRSGTTSAEELARHYLQRAEAGSATVGAYVTLTPELALRQARAADAALRDRDAPHAGGDGGHGDAGSPLWGVPVPVKDLTDVAGVRTSLGSTAWDWVAPEDAFVVRRLRAGGTVCLGKTNTPELGLPSYTENLVAPPARTPWDLDRSAGGSSGGAAAAVAAGLAPLAHGSDGGGSIRIPGSACGLVGLKPSRGRVSNGPWDAVGELGVHGPLARTVEDAAALLDVMAGPFPGDPVVAPPLPPGQSFLGAAREGRQQGPGRLRVGRYRSPVITDADLDPACVAAYDAASALLEELGHDVEDVDPPFGREIVPHFEVVWSVLSLLTPIPEGREHELLPLTRWLRERGRRLPALALAGAVTATRAATRRALAAGAAYDVVLTPTLARLPPPVLPVDARQDPAADFQAQKEFTPFTASYNVTGQPALSLPLHWTEDGLPVGVQLVGRPYDEVTLLRLGAQLEQARPWADRRPPAW